MANETDKRSYSATLIKFFLDPPMPSIKLIDLIFIDTFGITQFNHHTPNIYFEPTTYSWGFGVLGFWDFQKIILHFAFDKNIFKST